MGTFADRLARLRKRAGLTQAGLGEQAGIAQNLVCRYEAGDRLPRLETLRMLCDALDCTATDLLGW